jgi:hypothetical protein
MSELSSQFTREDIETLIEAMGDWEMLGNHEFHVMQMIRNAPMPPEEHEAFEVMSQIKEHYRKREKDIKMSREVRAEKAVFLKAKLMLVRKDLGITQLFDMSSNVDPNSPMPEPKDKHRDKEESSVREKAKAKPIAPTGKQPFKEGYVSVRTKLEKAEFFIKDLGVWDHYQKFLTEQQEEEQDEE